MRTVQRGEPSDELQWDYSCSNDVLSAWLGKPQPCDDVAVDDDIVVRISRETSRPVGIDVLSASRRSGKWTGALNGGYARGLLEQYGPVALRIWRTTHSQSG
jgi:uncharacterized protein YhjY with autotransporter beta-barrel domain